MSDTVTGTANDWTTGTCGRCHMQDVVLWERAGVAACAECDRERLDDEVASLRALRDAALALSRAVEPADLPPAARVELLTLRALLAAGGLDPLGDDAAVPPT